MQRRPTKKQQQQQREQRRLVLPPHPPSTATKPMQLRDDVEAGGCGSSFSAGGSPSTATATAASFVGNQKQPDTAAAPKTVNRAINSRLTTICTSSGTIYNTSPLHGGSWWTSGANRSSHRRIKSTWFQPWIWLTTKSGVLACSIVSVLLLLAISLSIALMLRELELGTNPDYLGNNQSSFFWNKNHSQPNLLRREKQGQQKDSMLPIVLPPFKLGNNLSSFVGNKNRSQPNPIRREQQQQKQGKYNILSTVLPPFQLGNNLSSFVGNENHSQPNPIRREQQQQEQGKDNILSTALPPRQRPVILQPLLSRSHMERLEEVIDMRVLNYKLAFDNPNGGAWKQGFDIKPQNKSPSMLRIFVVPHSHCDPGWIKTFDQYFRQQTSSIITTVVEALSLDVRRKFIWAEISYFYWWWEEQNEIMRDKVRRLLHAGQLEFVTGGWVQPDEANSELYAMEIQLQEGHDWIRGAVGSEYVPKYGWAIDPFGYSATAAYLWKKYNFTGMLIQRVHYAVKKELAKKQNLEFFWRQTWDDDHRTDATKITTVTIVDEINGQHIHPHDIFTHVMPFYSYDVPHSCGPDPAVCCQFDFARLQGIGPSCPWNKPPHPITPANVKDRAELLLDQYRKKAALYRSSALLAPLGDDFRYIQPREAEAQYTNYQLIFDYINEHIPDVQIQFGTLSEYFRAARESFAGPVPVLKGSFFTYSDMNEDYWSGYFTSRVFDKALDRQLERVLYAAESMGATRLELQSPRRALSLFQHHDGITGTAKNEVVDDYAQRIHEAISFTQQWMIQKAAESQLRNLLEIADVKDIRPCWLSMRPREWIQNLCGTSTSVAVYNPLPDALQYCGSVAVPGLQFAKAALPCEKPGPAKTPTTKFVFDPVTGLMNEPIQEEWKLWKVQQGGAYLFVPDQQDVYDLLSHNHKVEAGGFVVSTTFWKRTVVERDIPIEFGGRSVTAIDFIYETELLDGNQEWFTRFSSSTISNQGYFYTDLNGFNFDTHRFRSDMPIQSQVFPMPTLASIQDDHLRMTVLSEHAQGTASLQDGSIDVWLDRRLDQDDGRGLEQGVQDNRFTRTRLRVLLERDGYDSVGEFHVTPFGRRMWDELQHPLEMFGRHDTELLKTFLAEEKLRSEEKLKMEVELMESSARNIMSPWIEDAQIMPLDPRDIKLRDVTNTLHKLDNTIIPFVIVVHKRLDYLKLAMASLGISDFPRELIPLIISHDGHVPEVVEYVKTLKKDFQLVQLFHPHACYDHNNTFPADDPKLNEGYKGDAYGNPRSPWATCCKHHYTWLFKTIFSNEDFISKNIDTFLFLEEDYIVAPTIYQALIGGLNAMNEFENETWRGFLGLSLDPTNGNSEKLPPILVPDAWYGAAFLSGPMTLHRSTYAKIQQNADSFCGRDGFDEYNWDWTLIHMQSKELIPHTVLVPSEPLAKHIGIEGGMHSHSKGEISKAEFEKLDTRFFGTKVRGSFQVYPLMGKQNGGWGHPADREHCMMLLTTS